MVSARKSCRKSCGKTQRRSSFFECQDACCTLCHGFAGLVTRSMSYFSKDVRVHQKKNEKCRHLPSAAQKPLHKGLSRIQDLPSEVPSHLPQRSRQRSRPIFPGGRREVDGRCRDLTSRGKSPFYKGVSEENGRLGGLFRPDLYRTTKCPISYCNMPYIVLQYGLYCTAIWPISCYEMAYVVCPGETHALPRGNSCFAQGKLGVYSG